MNGISNYVQLIGNLGRDVEMKEMANGRTMARASLATKEIFRDQEGGRRVETTWHQVVGWGRVGEMMEKLLKRGSSVILQGKLKTYFVGEGEGRQVRTQVVVHEFRLMNGGVLASASSRPISRTDT